MSSAFDRFCVIESKDQLQGTGYFEFHPKDFEEEYTCWNEGSCFVDHNGFDLLVAPFVEVHPQFTYFGNTQYQGESLPLLVEKLQTFANQLRNSQTIEGLAAVLKGGWKPKVWAEADPKELSAALAESAEHLAGFGAQAREGSGCLWVLGL